MLTSFKEIDHPIYLFHDHLHHIFRNIFHYNLVVYNEEKLVHRDFRSIINSSKIRLLNPIKEIVEIYYQLPFSEKLRLQQALWSNNYLRMFDDVSVELVKFNELHPSISNVLKDFFENLWNHYPQNNEIEQSFGTVKDHYDKLIHQDNFNFMVCPFCGIDSFEPSEGKYREEYDHIIPKSIYPFTSINFKLLFPCCKKCNQQEKRKQDPLYEFREVFYNLNRFRRLSFYPYDPTLELNNLSINIQLNEKYDKENLATILKSVSWQIQILRNGRYDIRDESWDEVYGIKRRFTERINKLESQYYSELLRKFKGNLKSFQEFVDEILIELFYQIPIAGMGIIKYTYFNFIFNIPDIENKLRQVVAS